MVALQNRCVTEAQDESSQDWLESWPRSETLLPFVFKGPGTVINLNNFPSLYWVLGCPCGGKHLLSNKGKEETTLILCRNQGLSC